jgi:hypothetical protein
MKLAIIILFLSNSVFLKSQIIDSVSIKPFPDVDSIEFCHQYETNNDCKTYLKSGYYISCYCDYFEFIHKTNYRYREFIPKFEGCMVDEKKDGKWEYSNTIIPNSHMCCNEMHIWPDSIVTYICGKRIKKSTICGDFVFRDDGTIEITSYCWREYNLKIQCIENNCVIIANEKYQVRTFYKVYLDEELECLFTGCYSSEIQKIMNK